MWLDWAPKCAESSPKPEPTSTMSSFKTGPRKPGSLTRSNTLLHSEVNITSDNMRMALLVIIFHQLIEGLLRLFSAASLMLNPEAVMLFAGSGAILPGLAGGSMSDSMWVSSAVDIQRLCCGEFEAKMMKTMHQMRAALPLT